MSSSEESTPSSPFTASLACTMTSPTTTTVGSLVRSAAASGCERLAAALLAPGSKRYPEPLTVTSRTGFAGSASIFVRIRRTCSVTVASACHSADEPHTARNSCSRENVRPALPAK
jgi:hypothetical protein